MVYSLWFIDDYLKLWILLISRVVIAMLLYYAVMRIAGAVILKEVIAFFKGKKGIALSAFPMIFGESVPALRPFCDQFLRRIEA